MTVNDIKNIKISDFDYDLPDGQIPRHPLVKRDACRLLVSRPDGGTEHHLFSALPGLLPEKTLLVCNNTRVINARMEFVKSTGSRVEIFLLEPIAPSDYVLMFQTTGSCRWGCMVGNLKRWKQGQLEKEINIGGRSFVLRVTRIGSLEGNAHEILFEWDGDLSFASVVEAAGYIPIPPYLRRDSEASDAEDYQTVYARVKGSVAAPTAGLHFTPSLFDELKKEGVEVAPLTLHVGAGTFQPVKSECIGGHPMHTEVFSVSRHTLSALIEALETGRGITAVGTTSVRTLESLPYLGSRIGRGDRSMAVDQWCPYGEEGDAVGNLAVELHRIVEYMDANGLDELTASTSIMIAPGFKWRIVDAMVTNFHQPQSTLLLLVSSFLDRGPSVSGSRWRKIYEEALGMDYRFLSYGDACLLYPGE